MWVKVHLEPYTSVQHLCNIRTRYGRILECFENPCQYWHNE